MNPADANLPLRIASESLIGGLFRAIWGVKVTGREKVPATGPLIVACNHVSLIDPLLMAVAISPVRRPFGLGKKELFEKPVLGWYLRETGSFPLDRTGDATSAMRAALEVLERGGCVVIYPEGTRVKPGQTKPAKPGVAFLSARAQAPVIPIRVVGTAEFPRRFPLEARFGDPIAPPPAEDRETGLAYAKSVLETIYSL
jgi:1-acyl-sn-glycerol-3-phosphate acyltransferase